MILRIGTATGLAAALMLGTGCANGNGVEAETVLNYDQCQGLEAGLTRVDYSTIASIRGGRLLDMTDPNGAAAGGSAAPDADDADTDADAGTTAGAADDGPLLIALSRGSRPTAGYGFELEGVQRRGDTAVISVRWQTPDPDAVLAQIITRPCLVVALPRGVFERVEAVDQSGETFGSLVL